MNVGTKGHIDYHDPYYIYSKTTFVKMRPYVDGEDMSKIFISTSIVPEVGGMISNRGGKDMEYVTPEFFSEHYKPEYQPEI